MRIIATLFKQKYKLNNNYENNDSYDHKWVNKYYFNIKKHSPDSTLAIVTDLNDFPKEGFNKNIDVYNFEFHERGWASLLEMLNPEVIKEERALMTGLDTIIVSSLKKVEQISLKSQYISPLKDNNLPYTNNSSCNGVVSITKDLANELWLIWQKNRDEHLKDTSYFLSGRFSEMEWLNKTLTSIGIKINFWSEYAGPQIIKSYKQRGGPTKDTCIVYFHGFPKQPDIIEQEDWVKENW